MAFRFTRSMDGRLRATVVSRHRVGRATLIAAVVANLDWFHGEPLTDETAASLRDVTKRQVERWTRSRLLFRGDGTLIDAHQSVFDAAAARIDELYPELAEEDS